MDGKEFDNIFLFAMICSAYQLCMGKPLVKGGWLRMYYGVLFLWVMEDKLGMILTYMRWK